ncbi:MAG: hypothetical protein ACP5NZ_01270 [Nanobdellota archaeon]
MGEKREGVILSIFAVVILISVVSASFELGTPSNSIQTDYEEGDKINGWINISFTNQEVNDTFVSSFGNSVTLEDILIKNTNYVKNNTNSSINSTMQILYLNDSFPIPNVPGNLSFKLNFSNQAILSKNISLEPGENLTLKITISRKILEKEADIKSYQDDVVKYDLLIQKRLNQTFNPSVMMAQLNNIKTNYSDAEEDSDYYDILEELNNLMIPKMIILSKSADNIIFAPAKESINLNALAGITEEVYSEGQEDSYIEGIMFWSQSELDSTITFKEISVNYGGYEESLFSYFKVSFPNGAPEGAYLLIQEMQDLEFEQSSYLSDYETYKYINLDNFNGYSVSFVTSENVDFTNVPLFISPRLENVPRTEPVEYTEGERQMSVSRWIFFGLIILLLLVVTGVIYAIVQAWYDKKYENYLFPNRNNLYNLIIYINNSKKRGMKDDEIIKNLKESKWTQEQIRYVMRKYAGKRTGMARLFNKNPAENIQKKPVSNTINNNFQRSNSFQNTNTSNPVRKS